jgi:hypothetical protein
MKSTLSSILLVLLTSVEGFVPIVHKDVRGATSLFAKYNTMDEILAKFPSDKPVLINFYDAKTENDIKADIFRAKELLKDRATLVSIKQQDYPELAKKWDCADKVRSIRVMLHVFEFFITNWMKPFPHFHRLT